MPSSLKGIYFLTILSMRVFRSFVRLGFCANVLVIAVEATMKTTNVIFFTILFIALFFRIVTFDLKHAPTRYYLLLIDNQSFTPIFERPRFSDTHTNA